MGVRETPIATVAVSQGRLASDENFPVASRLLPRRQREHLMALYGFARLADDIGDESAGDRLAELDWLERELDLAFVGTATHPVLVPPPADDPGLPARPPTLRRSHRRQPAGSGRRRLRHVGRPASSYCALSANPVGRLVLAVFDVDTAERVRWSDDVCSALQVVEHLQDVGEDAHRGRIYLPAEDRVRHGCPDTDLLEPAASPALRAVVAELGGAGPSAPRSRIAAGAVASRTSAMVGRRVLRRWPRHARRHRRCGA